MKIEKLKTMKYYETLRKTKNRYEKLTKIMKKYIKSYEKRGPISRFSDSFS